jgi:hypothetical protein
MQAHHPMAFPSAEVAEQRKANFFATHQVIEAHNSQPGVTYELAHNSFSLLVMKMLITKLSSVY